MQDRLSDLTGEATLPEMEVENSSASEKSDHEEEMEEVSKKKKGKDKKKPKDEEEEEEMIHGEGQAEEFMHDFFEDVNAIKNGMSLIRKNIRAIEETYGQSLVAVGLEQGSKSSEDLEKLIDATNLAATDVRNRLKQMDTDIKKEEKEKGTAQARIRTNMHGTLTRKFLDLMAEYQEVQTKFKNKFRERVERQYRIVKPEATQEEIDDALDSGNTQVFAKEILNQRHAQAKDALNYIENRHKDILRLEQSIKELHQMFLDMAILVEAQGELIDQIEYNVSQAEAYSRTGVKNLREANQLQKKSRKKMCCIAVCLIIVLVLIGGGIGLISGLVGK